MTENRARLRKVGDGDTGYIIAQCDAPECRDGGAFAWQHSFSRRTVEGYLLAERDMNEHNRNQHAEKD